MSLRPLLRLLPYLRAYWLPFWAGIASLMAARIFEGFIPFFLKQGIDSLAVGKNQLLLPVSVIFG